ncbi:MAG: rRNA pseudouridine synthase [Clostridia bacterium]|nr:rRNA pseudouridine synthase [Clostridia bacterium]
MRLDKFLAVTATATRSEAGRAVRAGQVLVGGVPAKRADMQIDPTRDAVSYRGEPVLYREHYYILLNKPTGYVSATEDGREPTVLTLLPPKYTVLGLFPCGRLDKNTEGLMLLTDDGDTAHRLLSPRRHVEKRYRFTVKFPLTEEECARFREGLTLEDGYETKPADIVLDAAGKSGVITLVEGKYHQIKRMMQALHNQITSLERISFGPLTLPADLPRGAWRALTKEEETALLEAAK